MASYVVRCGAMRTLHIMGAKAEFARGMRVIARTPRGLELGEVLSLADSSTYSKIDGAPGGTIQREVNDSDEVEIAHLAEKADQEAETCMRVIRELDLPMDLVDIERVFGGERVVVYYLSESRVDFRELVKRLAHEFQTRVEMRQIGVRDEAKLLADYGDCGKPVCCNTHLLKMPPVSMKMAKLQKATLDPNKISGRCGRLKCCLRYEYDTYEENRKSLPRIGSELITAQGRCRVIGQELLTSQLLVRMEDNRRIMIHSEEVLTVLKKGDFDAQRRELAPESDEDAPRKETRRDNKPRPDTREQTKASDSPGSRADSDAVTDSDAGTDSEAQGSKEANKKRRPDRRRNERRSRKPKPSAGNENKVDGAEPGPGDSKN